MITLSIQKCCNCSKPFSYKEIFCSIWGGYRAIECNYCKTKHFIDTSNKIVFGLFLFPFFFYKGSYRIVVIVLWISLISSMSPFFVKYKIDKK
ncbi:TIGR04104 family putative zinc finger protein [Tepidibacter aestuarii]|uniref:TIGR04104 family putative zinc finger protein n=1 Tax=Tepidibacter aestuarii TaxID=2925782 RepID=UPI0038CD9C0E